MSDRDLNCLPHSQYFSDIFSDSPRGLLLFFEVRKVSEYLGQNMDICNTIQLTLVISNTDNTNYCLSQSI